ncbi:hypothetical protein KFK09_018780 [Dendrobium nobile]|uniref:K Homology domain-containing protein n=1 Tax=Dendrobium nobile TaxID=94219 RepID=A0A8T3AVB5_DENNO|nr:hypothetical protein KFK09_018780 [Dendrobium nobile]
MDSTDLGYSPPHDGGSKASFHPDSPSADDKERTTHIRFLVSNTAAGSIIGKGGSTITEFQSQSGARIQLSRNHEFFPGTPDRIIMLSGGFNEIFKAMELILDKLLNEDEDNHDGDARTKVRLIVPNSSCGAIIGKGGSTIKEKCNAYNSVLTCQEISRSADARRRNLLIIIGFVGDAQILLSGNIFPVKLVVRFKDSL